MSERHHGSDFGSDYPLEQVGRSEPAALEGMRRGHRRPFRDFMQGAPVRPLGPADIERPATRADVLDCAHELRQAVALLDELVQVDSGEVIVVRKRLRISAARPFDTFVVEAPDQFHSAKIDNPAAVPVVVNFTGTQPTNANADELVPTRTGRILTTPYDEIAIGIDPAVIPGGDTVIYCAFYSRPYPPTTYVFAP